MKFLTALCTAALCALLVGVCSAHPAVVVGGGSYGCNCATLNMLAARRCCATVGTCCLTAGMGYGYGGVGYPAVGYPGVGYAPLGMAARRPLLPLAHGGVQLNIGAGLG
ncbi:uncharacterized protein LOC144104480 [Amblyomma americanum]